MASKLSNMEQKLMDAMMKMANLSEALEPLKNKTKQNRQMAREAKAKSDNATQAADGLQQVGLCLCVCVRACMPVYLAFACMYFLGSINTKKSSVPPVLWQWPAWYGTKNAIQNAINLCSMSLDFTL